MTDFTPVVRSIPAANADVVFFAAYPPDTVGIVRAANEIGLTPKMFGGAMVGLLVTPIKVPLGPRGGARSGPLARAIPHPAR